MPSGQEVRVTSETGGAKGAKPQAMHLLPQDVLLDVSEHYYQGTIKYDARNWERGYAWSLSYAALLRHLMAWWGGEDNDPEFDVSHLRGVIFHALALRAFEMRGIGTDDRPCKEAPAVPAGPSGTQAPPVKNRVNPRVFIP